MDNDDSQVIAATIVVEPAPALVVYLDGLIDQLRQHVAGALQAGATESIHQARVTTRRLKAASDLLRPILPNASRKQFNDTLRHVRRRLGQLRDIDVMSGHIAELAGEAGASDACTWLRDGLHFDRVDALRAAQGDKVLLKLDSKLKWWQKLRRRMIQHAEAFDALLAESLHGQIDAFAARAAELDAHEPGVDPHAVRIAGKSLRYTIEMAAAHGHALDESLVKTFKKMQDALGLWHDHVVIVETATSRAAGEMLAHHDSAMQHGVLALASAAMREADRQLEKFKRLWNEQGAGLADAIRAAFPLSRAVEATESQTDRDPAGSAELPASEGPH